MFRRLSIIALAISYLLMLIGCDRGSDKNAEEILDRQLENAQKSALQDPWGQR
ncbi:MAG: hypothetical protein MK106_01495 [Mariniblastus sp.]|nr:hypothetical protein [Mariniblastus sp.]